MPSTRETRDSILRRISRTGEMPRGVTNWNTARGIAYINSLLPDSDDSSTAGSETCSDDDEENSLQPLPRGAPRIRQATRASPAASSLLRQTHQPRDAHLQSQTGVSADIAPSLASPFAQPVSSANMQNQVVLQYSRRILRDEIHRGRSRSPARGSNAERMRADNKPMDAANLEYEESATRNGVLRLPRQTAAELRFEAEFRRQHAELRAEEGAAAAAAVSVPAAGSPIPGNGSNRMDGDEEDDESVWPWHRMDQPMNAFWKQMRREDGN